MALANATLTASASGVQIFLCGNTGGSAVTSIWLKNHDTSARTVTLHACPLAEAVSDENMLLEVSIPAGETYTLDAEKLILSDTDDLKAFADVTSVVTATVSYLDL